MKIVYIANARIPTEKAHGLQIVKMCEAFANLGARVTLIIPGRKNIFATDIFSYYSVKNNFQVEYISLPDATNLRIVGFWINQLLFSFAVFFKKLNHKEDLIIFTRDELTGWLLRKRGLLVFYDMHGFPEHKRWFWKIAMRAMNGIITTNKWKIGQCHLIFGIAKDKMAVAPNGYDPALFEIDKSKTELRKELNLPLDASIVMYTGHLYDWKGAYILAEAASLRPNLIFVFVGGTTKDIVRFKEKYENSRNILILGYKPYQEIPRYLKAADVLVLPNSAFSKEVRFSVYSRFDTSPIKMFEYMASGVPIVASNLPSIREILNEKNAVLAEPDNPQDLANKIDYVLQNPEISQQLAREAKKTAKNFTWLKRAENILKFIQKTIATSG